MAEDCGDDFLGKMLAYENATQFRSPASPEIGFQQCTYVTAALEVHR